MSSVRRAPTLLEEILAEISEYDVSDDEETPEEETPEEREASTVRAELTRMRNEIEAHHAAIRAAEESCAELTRRLHVLCPPYVPTSPAYSPTSPAYD